MTNITKAEHAARVKEMIAEEFHDEYVYDMETYNTLFEAVRSTDDRTGPDERIRINEYVDELVSVVMPHTGNNIENVVLYMITMAVLHEGERAEAKRPEVLNTPLSRVVPITKETWAFTGYKWEVFENDVGWDDKDGPLYMAVSDEEMPYPEWISVESTETVAMWGSIEDRHYVLEANVYVDYDGTRWITDIEEELRLC